MKIQEITSLFFPNGMDSLGDVIGPQGNLLEKLEIFNTKYMTPDGDEPLKVTKTWRWGNGTYDRVKVAYNRKVMQWHKRPRGMNTLFNRKRAWFENDMKRELLNIEKYLIDARKDNAIWLTKDTDDGLLEQHLYEFCSKINNLEEILKKEADNYIIEQIKAKHYYHQYRLNGIADINEIIPGVIYITIFMKEKPIKVTQRENHIIDIPFPPLKIHMKMDVSKWLSHSINPQPIRDGYNARWQNSFGLAFDFDVPASYFDKDDDDMFHIGSWPIFHPFIQNHGNLRFGTEVKWYWRNYCWGAFGESILQSFFKMDFEAFFVHMNRWLYNYELIGANPLNNIRKSFLGISPEMMETAPDLFGAVGYDGRECHRQLSQIYKLDTCISEINDIDNILNYCNDTIQCQFSLNCSAYKENNIESMTAGLASTLAPINKTLKDEEMLDSEDVVAIHRAMVDRYSLKFSHRGNFHYKGTYMIWKESLENQYLNSKETLNKYTTVLMDSQFNITIMDSTVIGYLLLNKFFDAYVHIITLSSLTYNGWNITPEWDIIFKAREAQVDEYLQGLLCGLDKTNLSEEEKEKLAIQREMHKWTADIRNN